MAVITPANLSADGLSHTRSVDLLESGPEREPRELLALRLPPWAVAGIAGLLAVGLVAGVVSAVALRRQAEQQAARPDVEVRALDGSSSTVAGVARGVLRLLLVNRGRDEVQVDLGFFVEGLRLTGPVAEPLPTLRAGAERELRVPYLVPSCASLVLPGRVRLAVESDRQRVERYLSVVEAGPDPPPVDTIPLGACPASARAAVPGEPTDVGARAAGGQFRRVGPGAEGSARLEVRNGGAAVRLLAVDARVPGAVFTPRVLAGGLELPPDGLAIVSLRFRIPDCDRLQDAGWLLLRIERYGGVQELGLRLTAEPAGGLGPQAQLPVVLGACD